MEAARLCLQSYSDSAVFSNQTFHPIYKTEKSNTFPRIYCFLKMRQWTNIQLNCFVFGVSWTEGSSLTAPLILLHKKAAVLQSVDLGSVVFGLQHQLGFRLLHTFPGVVTYWGPPVFDMECINPPSYVRDPAFMLLKVQLLKTFCFLCIGWIPEPTQEVVSCCHVLASLHGCLKLLQHFL